MQVLRNVRVSQAPLLASLRVCELQRIDADELGQAGMQNGSLGDGIGLATLEPMQRHGGFGLRHW